MNVKETLSAIRALGGLTASHKDGEYRVTYSPALEPVASHREDCAYYTDCGHDALSTARYMLIEWKRKQPTIV